MPLLQLPMEILVLVLSTIGILERTEFYDVFLDLQTTEYHRSTISLSVRLPPNADVQRNGAPLLGLSY